MKYTAFVPDVTVQLPADPSSLVVENAIKNAAIELCRSSWVWREYAAATTVTAGEPRVDIELPASADLVAVLTVTLDGLLLDPESGDRLDSMYPRWATDTGTPKRFTQTDRSAIILSPVPDATYPDSLVIYYALSPTRIATSLPDWIANEYWESIVSGALARLMTMPGRPWTNKEEGDHCRDLFDSAIARARESGLRALGRAPARVTQHH